MILLNKIKIKGIYSETIFLYIIVKEDKIHNCHYGFKGINDFLFNILIYHIKEKKVLNRALIDKIILKIFSSALESTKSLNIKKVTVLKLHHKQLSEYVYSFFKNLISVRYEDIPIYQGKMNLYYGHLIYYAHKNLFDDFIYKYFNDVLNEIKNYCKLRKIKMHNIPEVLMNYLIEEDTDLHLILKKYELTYCSEVNKEPIYLIIRKQVEEILNKNVHRDNKDIETLNNNKYNIFVYNQAIFKFLEKLHFSYNESRNKSKLDYILLKMILNSVKYKSIIIEYGLLMCLNDNLLDKLFKIDVKSQKIKGVKIIQNKMNYFDISDTCILNLKPIILNKYTKKIDVYVNKKNMMLFYINTKKYKNQHLKDNNINMITYGNYIYTINMILHQIISKHCHNANYLTIINEKSCSKINELFEAIKEELINKYVCGLIFNVSVSLNSMFFNRFFGGYYLPLIFLSNLVLDLDQNTKNDYDLILYDKKREKNISLNVMKNKNSTIILGNGYLDILNALIMKKMVISIFDKRFQEKIKLLFEDKILIPFNKISKFTCPVMKSFDASWNEFFNYLKRHKGNFIYKKYLTDQYNSIYQSSIIGYNINNDSIIFEKSIKYDKINEEIQKLWS